MISINPNDYLKLHLEIVEAAKNPPPCELIYLVGPQGGDQPALFDAASEFSGCAFAVFGLEGLEHVGYEGYEVWKNELVKRGIPYNSIVPLPGTPQNIDGKPTFNSFSEMLDLARFAHNRGYVEVGFIAPHWQIMRSFMGAVAAARPYPELRINPILARPQLWDDVVRGSQNAFEAMRADLMMAEAWRIIAYQAKGDLPSIDEVRKYLNSLP